VTQIVQHQEMLSCRVLTEACLEKVVR
jgi:hypothetical protein